MVLAMEQRMAREKKYQLISKKLFGIRPRKVEGTECNNVHFMSLV